MASRWRATCRVEVGVVVALLVRLHGRRRTRRRSGSGRGRPRPSVSGDSVRRVWLPWSLGVSSPLPLVLVVVARLAGWRWLVELPSGGVLPPPDGSTCTRGGGGCWQSHSRSSGRSESASLAVAGAAVGACVGGSRVGRSFLPVGDPSLTSGSHERNERRTTPQLTNDAAHPRERHTPAHVSTRPHRERPTAQQDRQPDEQHVAARSRLHDGHRAPTRSSAAGRLFLFHFFLLFPSQAPLTPVG